MLTFEIQLRTEDVDADKKQLLVELMREKAREIYALAQLLKEKREPQIMFQTGDMFETNRDLEILSEADLAST